MFIFCILTCKRHINGTGTPGGTFYMRLTSYEMFEYPAILPKIYHFYVGTGILSSNIQLYQIPSMRWCFWPPPDFLRRSRSIWDSSCWRKASKRRAGERPRDPLYLPGSRSGGPSQTHHPTQGQFYYKISHWLVGSTRSQVQIFFSMLDPDPR